MSVAASTEIDAKSFVTFSTIGANCKIGKNVRIINSIIGKSVTIGDNSCVVGSIIWDNVSLGAGVTVQGGCTVTQGVKVKDGVILKEFSVASLNNYDPEEKCFVKSEKANTEFFLDGVMSYLPRDMTYGRTELIVASSGYDQEEVESDLDEDLEESDEDPKDEFMEETEGLFADSFN